MEPSNYLVSPESTPSECGAGLVPNRRKDPRFVPVMESAYLGWWEGETLRAELGILWNISAGGAAMDIGAEVELGETVWLCVVDLSPVQWVAARLVGREGRVVRLQFAEPFPYELLEAVVWGQPVEATTRAVAEPPLVAPRA